MYYLGHYLYDNILPWTLPIWQCKHNIVSTGVPSCLPCFISRLWDDNLNLIIATRYWFKLIVFINVKFVFILELFIHAYPFCLYISVILFVFISSRSMLQISWIIQILGKSISFNKVLIWKAKFEPVYGMLFSTSTLGTYNINWNVLWQSNLKYKV